jgi:hypothetical protein
MRFDLLKRREFMGYRGVIGSFMLTAAMLMATSGTRAHDEAKYPFRSFSRRRAQAAVEHLPGVIDKASPNGALTAS